MTVNELSETQLWFHTRVHVKNKSSAVLVPFSVTDTIKPTSPRRKRAKKIKAALSGFETATTPPLPVKTTELKTQWDGFRAEYPGHLLLYQCGDFFELYDEDADLVETLTNLKVTEKNTTGFKRMAGFPVRVVNDWIRRLLQCGVGKIAMIEQCDAHPRSPTVREDVDINSSSGEGLGEESGGMQGNGIKGAGKGVGIKSKIVARQVTRVFTPGTLYDTDESGGRHLVSLAVVHESEGVCDPGATGAISKKVSPKEFKFGVSYVDLETSEFNISSSVDVDHLDEILSRLNVAELLLTEDAHEYILEHYPSLASRDSVCHTVLEPSWFLDSPSTVRKGLDALHWGMSKGVGDDNDADQTIKQVVVGVGMGVGQDHMNLMETMATSALLRYISHTHPASKPRLRWPTRHTISKHMVMDSDTRRALELVTVCNDTKDSVTALGAGTGESRGGYSLYSVLNRCRTFGGRRLLRSRVVSPSTDMTFINQCLSSVAVLKTLRNTNRQLRLHLKECVDVEKTLQRIALKVGTWADLRSLASTIAVCATISDTLLQRHKADDQTPTMSDLGLLFQHVDGLTDANAALKDSELWKTLVNSDAAFFANHDGTSVPLGFDKTTDELTERLRVLETISMHRLRLEMFTATSRFKLVRNNRQGWIFEISQRHLKAEKEQISIHGLREVEGTSLIKRFSCKHLDAFDRAYRELEAELAVAQRKIFQRLSHTVRDNMKPLLNCAQALNRLDVASSLAIVADEYGFCRPTITQGIDFDVEGGFHAAVKKSQQKTHDSFVPNDCNLTTKRMWIVTGPNMGGKSTFLRQNALMIIMAQIGSFVPAHRAVIGVCDQLFARVGANDDISRHMSTFMVEMMETARILQKATHRSFVVLDEIGRGTSTYDGMAIASAVFEHLHDNTACRTLSATHYKEVAHIANHLSSAACYRTIFSYADDEIIYGYRLEPGVAQKSYGIDVARIAGIPSSVTTRARDLLLKLEHAGGDLEHSLVDTIVNTHQRI
eukprot:CFRG0213T1